MARYQKLLPVSVALLLISASTLSGQNVTVTDSSPIEAKLAGIDRGSIVVPQSVVREYGRLLDRAHGRCTQSRTFVADMVVKATQILKKDYNKTFTIREILQAFDVMMSEAGFSQRQDCGPLITLLVITLGGS